MWWTWLVVFGGQILVALCFAELAGQYPLAGSVYQWSKQIGGDFTSWMTGWIYIIGAIVTVAAVAVAWQVVLPQIDATRLPVRRRAADAGTTHTKAGQERADPRRDPGRHRDDHQHARRQADGADQQHRRDRRADRLDRSWSSCCSSTSTAARRRSSTLVGTGAGHPWGYFGAFLIGGIMSAYVMYGFDTAGTLGRGDQRPAPARATGDHPRDRGGRDRSAAS